MKLSVLAVCGNTSALNDMRVRILLDQGKSVGRNILQTLQIATKHLPDDPSVSADWKNLMKQDSALQLLIFPREGCGHCDLASHVVRPQMIAASLSTFEDEEDLLIIFRAVYGSDISTMSEVQAT